MTASERNAAASAFMARGLELMGENAEPSLAEAIGCFDRAIELRRDLPWQENSWFAYVLAASWMNRADALTRLGSAWQLSEALSAHDEALAVLSQLRLDEHPLYRRRQAVCWLNRGSTRYAQGQWKSASDCFTKAIEIARPASPESDCLLVLANALANRANALLRAGEPAAARPSAEEAISILLDLENENADAAETGLKARLVACQCLARLGQDAAEEDDSISMAIDHAEEGLRVARHWEQRGETRLHSMAEELLRFGGHAYEMRQPQFLAEFIDEHTASSPALRDCGLEMLSRAFWSEIRRSGFRAGDRAHIRQLAAILAKARSQPRNEAKPPMTNGKPVPVLAATLD